MASSPVIVPMAPNAMRVAAITSATGLSYRRSTESVRQGMGVNLDLSSAVVKQPAPSITAMLVRKNFFIALIGLPIKAAGDK